MVAPSPPPAPAVGPEGAQKIFFTNMVIIMWLNYLNSDPRMVIKNEMEQKLGGKNVWKLVRPGILTQVVNIWCFSKLLINN